MFQRLRRKPSVLSMPNQYADFQKYVLKHIFKFETFKEILYLCDVNKY